MAGKSSRVGAHSGVLLRAVPAVTGAACQFANANAFGIHLENQSSCVNVF